MKAVLAIIRKSLPASAIYFGVFCVLLLIFNQVGADNNQRTYEGKSLTIVINAPDASLTAKALGEVLAGENTVLYNLTEDVIMDRVFNGSIDYAIYFPEGYDEAFEQAPENSKVETMSINASVAFLNQKTEQFFRYVRTGLATGKTLSESCDFAKQVCQEETGTEIQGKTRSIYQIPGFYFFTYLAYLFLAVMIFLIGPVVQSFYRREIRMRTSCSATISQKLTLHLAAGTGMGALGVFGILICIGAILYHENFTVAGYLLSAFNAFVFLLVSVTIAIVVGVLLPDKNALNGASNLISMGMCFLGGVFVRGDLLPEYVHRIGQFLPVSWYVKNIYLLFSINWEERMGEYFGNLGVIFLFAVAFFCIALVAARKKKIA